MRPFKENRFHEILEVMTFAHVAASSFWRAIYAGGMWLTRAVATSIISDGWNTVAPLLSKCNDFVSSDFRR